MLISGVISIYEKQDANKKSYFHYTRITFGEIIPPNPKEESPLVAQP